MNILIRVHGEGIYIYIYILKGRLVMQLVLGTMGCKGGGRMNCIYENI